MCSEGELGVCSHFNVMHRVNWTLSLLSNEMLVGF